LAALHLLLVTTPHKDLPLKSIQVNWFWQLCGFIKLLRPAILVRSQCLRQLFKKANKIMKKDSNSILGDIVFAFTLASLWISFYLATVVGEFNIFGIAGVVRYSWIMLLFIIVPVLSILIGIRLKKWAKIIKRISLLLIFVYQY